MNNLLPDDLQLRDIERGLLYKQRQIEQQLKELELSDPVLLDMAPEPGELGTDAWQADVHAKNEVLKNSLLNLYSKVKCSLNKLKDGTYGQCDRCRREIEKDRLKAIPTAALCSICMTLPKSF